MLADNKLALNAGWDEEILAIEFQHLALEDLSFDLEITGFETAEIDLYVDGQKTRRESDPLDIAPTIETPLVTKAGDLWLLGSHKVLCGDSQTAANYSILMSGARAQVMFADPPYNVSIDGHVSGLGRIKHREFIMGSGELTHSQFQNLLTNTMKNCAAASVDGAIHFVCMDWRHIEEIMAAGRAVYSELKNLCIWNKDNGGMGSFYRSKHELVFVFKVGSGAHINTIELGRSGRYRTNVWDYAGVNTMRAGRLKDLAMHPTVKPVALVIDALKDCSRRGDIVLDPFGGSGTTLIAAEKSKRCACIIELDPAYVDVTIRRWQSLTGGEAVHADTKRTFADTCACR